MGQILIRGIPEDVMDAFKARAKRHGRSQEEEARRLIVEAAREHEAWVDFIDYTDRTRARLSRRETRGGDAVEDVRADRSR